MPFTNSRGKKRKFSDSDVSEEENGLSNRDEDEDSTSEEVDSEEMEDDGENSESDVEQDDDDSQEDDYDDSECSEDEANDENDSDDASYSTGKVAGQDPTLQPAANELDKAKAVTCQLRFWEHLLKMRVNLQKAMIIINQLPQCERLREFVSSIGESDQQAITDGHSALKQLIDRLLELEFLLLNANSETKTLLSGSSQQTGAEKETAEDEDDEEITSESEAGSGEENLDTSVSSSKQSVKSSEVPHLIAKRHRAVEKYRNNTIQKWADKTQSLSKFAAFDQSVAKQIQQTLADKARLVARTKVNRLGNPVLGKIPLSVDAPAATTSNDQDEEIFDDNDFYHHILREFIQYKNSYDPIVLTKQWLEIQQYRKKAKKNVDRKASKGRKTRYNVHKPLINFMAPVNSPDSWTNEQRDDLFKNLFGRALGAV